MFRWQLRSQDIWSQWRARFFVDQEPCGFGAGKTLGGKDDTLHQETCTFQKLRFWDQVLLQCRVPPQLKSHFAFGSWDMKVKNMPHTTLYTRSCLICPRRGPASSLVCQKKKPKKQMVYMIALYFQCQCHSGYFFPPSTGYPILTTLNQDMYWLKMQNYMAKTCKISIFSGQIQAIEVQTLTNWWFQPPWKLWVRQIWIVIPTIGENKKCSKPPTSSWFSLAAGKSSVFIIPVTQAPGSQGNPLQLLGQPALDVWTAQLQVVGRVHVYLHVYEYCLWYTYVYMILTYKCRFSL